MSISKNIVDETGVVLAYHRIVRVTCNNRTPASEWSTTVASWRSKDAYVAGERQRTQFLHALAITPTPGTGMFGQLEEALVTDSTSQWFGGSVEPEENLTPLSIAKDKKWREIKALRDAKEFSTFTWDGSPFDTDAASQSRIQGAFQLAILAVSQSQSFSIDWTLADNTVRTMTAADLIAFGTALGTYVGELHYIARGLRVAIEAATTVEEVEGVQWPAPVVAAMDGQGTLGDMTSSGGGTVE